MGLIARLLGGPAATTALATAATNVAGAFVPNATRRMELSHEAYDAALAQHAEEFRHARPGFFDRLVNGLNQMPRPMLALGTMGLFAFAMVDPARFTERMVGLSHVPEPLWWLLGAIVSFYFGAREAYYFRSRGARGLPAPAAPQPAAAAASTRAPEGAAAGPDDAAEAFEAAAAGDNPALAEWRALRRG